MKGQALKTALFGLAAAAAGLALVSCAKAPNPNVLTSELLPIPDNPLVSLRFLVKVGSAYDPSGKEGLCQLAWSMLADAGSQTMSLKDIAKAFYPLAASVSWSVDKEMSVFAGTVHRDNLEKYYAILKDMLLAPGFREEDFNRLKTNQLNFVEKTLVNNMDEQFGKEILNLILYEGHPYGHTEAGTAESVRSITLDDVKAFIREHFVQGNVVVGLAGGYPADFSAKVLADFSKLPKTFTPRLKLPAPRRPQGLEAVIADKTTPATAISMGFPVSLTKADRDFFALWIAGSHFGEHRQHVSLLFQKIREERGQNYGDYAYIEHFVQGRDKFPAPNHARSEQYFSIWIRPLQNSNRHFVIRQALRELKKLVEEGIPEERFELVRTYLLNYTKLYAQTLEERLGWQMDSHFYGDDDFLAKTQEVLPRLTREDVNKAIRKYLNAKNVYLAVITQDAESLRNDLAAGMPSPIKYANPAMPQEVLDEDTVIQVFPLDLDPGKVRIAAAASFFQKAGIPEK
jgi:zinc protease